MSGRLLTRKVHWCNLFKLVYSLFPGKLSSTVVQKALSTQLINESYLPQAWEIFSTVFLWYEMKSKTKQTAIFVSGTGTGNPRFLKVQFRKKCNKNRIFKSSLRICLKRTASSGSIWLRLSGKFTFRTTSKHWVLWPVWQCVKSQTCISAVTLF